MDKIKTFMLVLLIIIFYAAMFFIAINDYPVVPVLAPTTIFIGWFIWQRQELAKRKSDAAENLLKSYWKYEKYITSVYLTYSSFIREDPFSITIDKVKELMEVLEKDVKLCKESEVDFHLAINLFFFKTSKGDQYKEITAFRSLFYKYSYLISLSDDLLNMNMTKLDFGLLGTNLKELSDSLTNISFSEVDSVEPLAKQPRKKIQDLTKNYLNLETL